MQGIGKVAKFEQSEENFTNLYMFHKNHSNLQEKCDVASLWNYSKKL